MVIEYMLSIGTKIIDPEVTVDGMHSVALHTCFSEPTSKI